MITHSAPTTRLLQRSEANEWLARAFWIAVAQDAELLRKRARLIETWRTPAEVAQMRKE